jgi:hypothetical protein
MEELGLKDLLRQTRLEIEAAAREREAAGEEGLFQVDSVTIEANFIVRKNAGVEGSFKLLAVTLDGSGKYEKEQVQKVTVVLSPVSTPKSGTSVQPWLMDEGEPLVFPHGGPSGKGARPAPHDLLMKIPSSGARLWVTPSIDPPSGPMDLNPLLGKDSED